MSEKYASTFQHMHGVRVPEHVARTFFAIREVTHRSKVRAKLASDLRDIRAEWRQTFGTRKDSRLHELCRKMIGNSSFSPVSPNPTVRNLKREAKRLLTFSKTPIPNYSTEYYSACGAEDAAGERRDQARDLARLLMIATKRISAGTTPPRNGSLAQTA